MRSLLLPVALLTTAIVACKGQAPAPATTAEPTASAASAVVPTPPPSDSEVAEAIDSLMVMSIDAQKTLADAIATLKPIMQDARDEPAQATQLLARWATHQGTWKDFAVAKDETSFALVKKDSESERGKRLCVSGTIVQIARVKTPSDRLFAGLLDSTAKNIFQFYAAGSSGSLVELSHARLCGVVTGRYDYQNSGGGTGHGVSIVGMFDLPENRAAAK